MPIIDVEIVSEPDDSARQGNAQSLADVLGQTLGTPAGRTWVRVHRLDRGDYAESHSTLEPDELPVFVTVLHVHPPTGEGRVAEARAITAAVARATGRPPERVHVQYSTPGAGRQAFGGAIVE